VGGLSTPAVELHDVLGTNDFMRYSWEAARNANLERGQDPVTAGQNAAAGLITSLQYNPYNVAQPVDANGNIVPGAELLWETNWEDEILNDVAMRQEYGVSLSGGGDKS